MRYLALLLVLLLLIGCGKAGVGKVELVNADEEVIARAYLSEGEGGVKIRLTVDNLPEGLHGFHIHENGACEGPDFSSAGGHFNPFNTEHGLNNADGPHIGDMQNIYVGPDGKGVVEVMASLVTGVIG